MVKRYRILGEPKEKSKEKPEERKLLFLIRANILKYRSVLSFGLLTVMVLAVIILMVSLGEIDVETGSTDSLLPNWKTHWSRGFWASLIIFSMAFIANTINMFIMFRKTSHVLGCDDIIEQNNKLRKEKDKNTEILKNCEKKLKKI